MSLNVKVKTLESDVFDFNVDQNLTVKQFKEIIEKDVNVPVDRQRLIFCGRVLQDDKKLTEYIATGQTLHLVQKPPPSLRPSEPSTAHSSANTSSSRPRVPEESFLVGAFSLPPDSFDANGLQQVVENVMSGMGEIGRNATIMSRTSEDGSSVDVHINLGHVPIQSEVQQRMQNANRIIRYINRILDDLEGRDVPPFPGSGEGSGSGSPSQTASSFLDAQAQIAAHAAGALAAATASAFSNSLGIGVQNQDATENNSNQETSAGASESSTPSDAAGESQNTTRNAGQNAGPRSRNLNGNVPTSELLTLFTTLQSAEERYRQHLNRFQQMIASESEMNSTQIAEAQRLQRNIFRAMHHFAHVYHMISDFSINFTQSPPRNLRVLQPFNFGIPITIANRQPSREASQGPLRNNNNNNNININNNNTINNNNNNNNLPTTTAESFATVGSTTTSTYSVPRFSQSNSTGQSSSVFVAQSPIVFMEVGSASIERIPGPAPRSTQTTSQPTSTTTSQSTSTMTGPRIPAYSSFFDPYLTCNSQYSIPEIRTRVSVGISASNSDQPQNNQEPRNTTAGSGNTSNNAMGGLNQLISGIMNAFLGQATNLQQTRQQPAPRQPQRQQQHTISVDSSLVDLINRLQQNTPAEDSRSETNETTETPSGNMTDMFISFVNGIIQIINGQNNAGTVGEFLTRVDGFTYTEGESITNDIFMVVARILSFEDLFQILFFNNPQPLDRVRDTLRQFVVEKILHGNEPTEDAITNAVEEIISRWSASIENLNEEVRLRPDIDFRSTIMNFIRLNLIRLIRFLVDPPQNNFGSTLYNNMRTIISEFVALCLNCFTDGVVSFESMITVLIRNISSDLDPLIQQWMIATAIRHARESVTNLQISSQNINYYIVSHTQSSTLTGANEQEEMETENAEFADALSDVDVNESESEATRREVPVLVNSESWHSSVPSNWVPIITNDLQVQRRQPLQRPFSDAYLSGLPKKKRKVEPRSAALTQPHAFRDSLRNALLVSGVQPASRRSEEEVLKDAENDASLQEAFREQLRSEVSERLNGDTDFDPERFVYTKKYLNSFK